MVILFICFNLIFFYAAGAIGSADILLSFLLENSQHPILVLFQILGVVIGGLIWFKIFKNVKNPFIFCFLNIPLGSLLFCIALFPQLWSIMIIFVGLIGVSMLIGNIAFLKKITTIERRGHFIGLIITCFGGIFLLGAILSAYLPNTEILFMLIGGIFILLGCASFFFNRKFKSVDIIKKEEIYIQDLNTRDIFYYNISIFLVFIVIGISVWQIMTNPTMHQLASDLGSLFFGANAYTVTAMENTNFVLGITIFSMAYIVGILMDRIGRTKVILLGLFIACIGLFFIGFFSTAFTLLIAWIFIGIETSIFFNLPLTISLDIGEKKFKSYLGYPWISFFSGLGVGFILGFFTQSYSFSYVTLVLLVIFPSAIIVILHAKDSLPSKEEREWRDCINHLFLISHTGMCIYEQSFQGEKLINRDLFAGGLSGVISLIQELTNSDERIEVFSQKDKKIIIHYGKYLTGALISSKDLKILHLKLRDLLYNYEDIFQDYFKTWTGDISQFDPGIHLVNRFFT